MARKFMYDGKDLGDPDPEKSIDEVRQMHAEFFPELYNAVPDEKKDKDDTVITFTKRVGTKGGDLGPECRLGWCGVKKSHYGGGSFAPDQIKKGVCPICGGPATKGEAGK